MCAQHSLHASLPPHLQCGSRWTCKLDGDKGGFTIDTCKLHATEPAVAEHSLPAFGTQVLAESLPLEDVETWLQEQELQSDLPVDLLLVKPHSLLMLEVLTRQSSITVAQVNTLRKHLQRTHCYGLTSYRKEMAAQIVLDTKAGHVACQQP